MGWTFDNVGRLIARLQKPANHCEPFTPNDSMALRDALRPGDVLLVEGKGRILGSIKYLTQSTWSHSALYVGPMAGAATDSEPHVLIEAIIDEGVVSAPLSKYLALPNPNLPAGGPERCGLRKGLSLRLRAHWSRLPFQELSIPMAACASLAAPNDRARLRGCQSHHLFVADCPSIRRRAVPNSGRRGAKSPRSVTRHFMRRATSIFRPTSWL